MQTKLDDFTGIFFTFSSKNLDKSKMAYENGVT